MNHQSHTQKNKQALRDALVNTCKGSAENMTVSTLCRIAGVSRASFYNYYDGIHSIIEEIEHDRWKSFRSEDYPHERSRAYFTVQDFSNNKAEWYFLLHNGDTRNIIMQDTKKVLQDNLSARNCTLPKNMLEIFTLAIVPSMIEIILLYLSGETNMQMDNLAVLFTLMEHSTYDMVLSYTEKIKTP